mmetsp:Transcript_43765/g.52497  ORF Transcript_43765/g.52497 Transcript_43765/m.52497 type:complete len:93 (+) Transcript_43765:296-574(+)
MIDGIPSHNESNKTGLATTTTATTRSPRTGTAPSTPTGTKANRTVTSIPKEATRSANSITLESDDDDEPTINRGPILRPNSKPKSSKKSSSS